jgi:hypothetical protein
VIVSGRSGYRKTDRKNPRPDPTVRTEIRLVFLLPSILMLAVAPGPQGAGVDLLDGGVVSITGSDRNEVLGRLADFLLPIASGKMLTPIPARLVSSRWPDHPEGFHIVVNSEVTLTRTAFAPAIFSRSKPE